MGSDPDPVELPVFAVCELWERAGYGDGGRSRQIVLSARFRTKRNIAAHRPMESHDNIISSQATSRSYTLDRLAGRQLQHVSQLKPCALCHATLWPWPARLPT
jgi:hypothetical protein